MKDKPAKKIFGKALPKPWKPLVPALEPPKVETLAPKSSKGSLPRKEFEPIISRPVDLDRIAAELVIHLHDIDGDHEVKTCIGDIYKIVNALMDYSRLLELVCDEWDLQGFHRAIYEYHAEKLRAIAKKYQTAIGYDYDAAVAKCEAKKKRGRKEDDIGGDALELTMKRGRQSPEKKEK